MNAAIKTGFRAFTVHEEQGITGVFRVVRVGNELQTQCEVEIVKTRTLEQRSRYKTFRPARPEDHELARLKIRSHK